MLLVEDVIEGVDGVSLDQEFHLELVLLVLESVHLLIGLLQRMLVVVNLRVPILHLLLLSVHFTHE